MAYHNTKPENKAKAKLLINSFERQEGLDPEKVDPDYRVEIDSDEMRTRGNTVRLAALFDNVQVGEVRQRAKVRGVRRRTGSRDSSSSDRETNIKVYKTKRISRRGAGSSSDSDSRTKTTTVTKVTRSVRRDGSSDHEGVVTRKVTKVNLDAPVVEQSQVREVKRDSSEEREFKFTKQRKARITSRDSSSDEGQYQVTTRTTTIVKRDSSDERKKKNVVMRKRRDSSEERRRSVKVVKTVKVQRDSSDEGKKMGGVKVMHVGKTPKRDSSDERRKVTKTTKVTKFEKRDSSDERRRSGIKARYIGKVDRRDSSDERTVTKTVKVTKFTGRDSSDERKKIDKVKVVKAAKVEKRDSSDERMRRTVRVDKVEKRDSSDDRRNVKVVTVTKTERRDSSDERKPRRLSAIVRRDSSIERPRPEVVSKRISQWESQRRDSSEEREKQRMVVTRGSIRVISRDSSDERRQKNVTVVKKTTVVTHAKDSSDSEDDRRQKTVVRMSRSPERKTPPKEVKVTKVVAKPQDTSSVSQHKKTVIVKQRTNSVSSNSDRDVGAVKKTTVVKHEGDVHVVKKTVIKTDRDSDDARKAVKVTKVKRDSSSSDDERRTKRVEHIETVTTRRVTKSERPGSASSESSRSKVEVKSIKTNKSRYHNKNVLIVFAHVFKESFEGSLVGAAIKALEEEGAHVATSNLYAMGYNPVASPKDFGEFVDDREFYNYSLLAGQAKSYGKLAQDIVTEQDKIQWADLIIIVSQMQSHGLPALLKGWFDRNMTYNFAYADDQFYERGRLSGKKAFLCLTSEALASMYTPRGIHGDLNVYLWPIVNGLLRFAGFDVLKPHVYFGVGRSSREYREQAIHSLQERIRNIFSEETLPFIDVDRFSQNRGYTLSDRRLADLVKEKRVTIAQYNAQNHVSLAVVIEPEGRRDEAEKIVIATKREHVAVPSRPWHTMW